MSKDITYIIPPREGQICPSCCGLGTAFDGSVTVSTKPDGTMIVTSRPASKCALCQGKRRVIIIPIPD